MNKLRVLLVDDEENYLRTVAKIFRHKQIEVELCSNSLEAIKILLETQCQVVVLDLKMPGKSGRNVLLEIKEVLPEIQVIILTGHATTEEAADCLTGGAFDFLLKPVDIDELINKIFSAYEVWKIVSKSQNR